MMINVLLEHGYREEFIMIKELPKSELRVMQVIWKYNKNEVPSTVITKKLEESKAWKRTTTLTLLSRLVDKGFLEVDKSRRCSYYTVKITKEEYLKFAIELFIRDVLEGNDKELYEILKTQR